MSQHDFNIANQTASNARADINNAFKALASLSSGSTAPSTTYENMLWYDTGNNILKMRAEADDTWINIGYLDQSADAFRILDDTQVVNTSGTQTGLLGDQATATWETGTSTTESLVSPAKVKAAVEALSPDGGGLTLLGTLTTTSGATQTLSGLDLTDYKFLRIVMDGVDMVFSPAELQLEGTPISPSNDTGLTGMCLLEFPSGVFSSVMDQSALAAAGKVTGLSTSDTSLTFSWSVAGNFSAGEINVYGEK